MQITEVSKVTKSFQCNLIFIFIKLLETSNSFVKMRLVIELKNVAYLWLTL